MTTGASVSADPNEIRKIWQIIPVETDSPILLRAIEAKGSQIALPTQEGLFTATEFPDLAKRKRAFELEAARLNGLGYNVYAIMNPIRPDFILGHGKGGSVGDDDIIARAVLLIDIDRADKAECPASDQEVQAIKFVAREIRAFLSDQGWPLPIRVFSGNGFHLYWGLDRLPNNEDVKFAIRGLLQALAARFNTADARVDTAVFNSSRITKVPGTLARKGMESPTRNYQMARVLDDFDLEPVTQPQVRSVTSMLWPALKPKSLRVKAAPAQGEPDTPRRRARLADKLMHISADCEYERYCQVVWAIMSTGWPDAPNIARDWSMTSPDRFTEGKLEKLLEDYNPDHERPVTLGTITMLARQGGWNG